MDDVVKEKVSQFESNMLDYFRGPQKALRDELAAAKSFKGLDEKFVAALKTFKQSWKN